MSTHSTPYYGSIVRKSPVYRPRSLTYPTNERQIRSRTTKLESISSCEIKKPQYTPTQREGTRLNSCSSTDSGENSNGKWKKLNEMIVQVENMKLIVDHLFPSVQDTQYEHVELNYSGRSEYDIQVEKLRQTIEEQISRMKAYWSGEGNHIQSSYNEHHYELEQMRSNIAHLFNKMKTIVEGLIPSVEDEFKLTRSRVFELKNQIENLEKSVKQLSESSEQFQSKSPRTSPISEPALLANFGRKNSIKVSANEARIKELEAELESSLKREEALQTKVKLLEERKDKERNNLEDHILELEDLLKRSSNRAKRSSDEAYELKLKVGEMATEAKMNQYQLGKSEQKRVELEEELAVRRGNDLKSYVGQLRTSPDTHFTYRPDESVHKGNLIKSRSLEQPINPQVKPPGMSMCKQRNMSVASQGTRLYSPRDTKQVNFYRDAPVMGYTKQTGREYYRPNNLQRQIMEAN